MSALRTTWQVSRLVVTLPAFNTGTTATKAMTVVGTYVGDQVAATSLAMQPDTGVPFVELDAYAFLDVSADVLEGDRLVDLERSTAWECKTVRTYTAKRIVGLKAVKPKSYRVGPV